MQRLAKRSDAQAHRQLLLDAADLVFTDLGVHVALELVTQKAGLTRATLYRNFPDRTALMSALLERAFERLDLQSHELHGKPDGLFRMLAHMADLVAVSAPVADHWRAADRHGPVLTGAQKRLTRMVAPLLQLAIESGACRPDLTTKDVVLVTSMFGACLRGRTVAERRRLSKRALQLLLDGLRPVPRFEPPSE